jgi:hypothetical protein
MLRSNEKEMRKVGKTMSQTVIAGSMEIWQQNAKKLKEEQEMMLMN